MARNDNPDNPIASFPESEGEEINMGANSNGMATVCRAVNFFVVRCDGAQRGLMSAEEKTESEERFLHCVSRLLRRSEGEEKASAHFGPAGGGQAE
jgi:hypothetical protein